MKKQIGFILNNTKYYAILIIPFHYIHFKYQKIQVKTKKYYIINYKQEYNKGDIIVFNLKTNKISIYYKI